jgi:hypothetical protein
MIYCVNECWMKRFWARSSVIDKLKFLSIEEQDCVNNLVLCLFVVTMLNKVGRLKSGLPYKTLAKTEGFLYAS